MEVEAKAIFGFEAVMSYIKEMDCFHDYRTGGFDYEGDTVSICIEEDWPLDEIKDYDGPVWKLDLIGLSSFRFGLDTALGFWVREIVCGDKPNEIVIDLENGTILATAKELRISLIKPGKGEGQVYFPT